MKKIKISEFKEFLNIKFPSETADLLDFPLHCLYKHKGKSSKSAVSEANLMFQNTLNSEILIFFIQIFFLETLKYSSRGFFLRNRVCRPWRGSLSKTLFFFLKCDNMQHMRPRFKSSLRSADFKSHFRSCKIGRKKKEFLLYRAGSRSEHPEPCSTGRYS